MSTKCENVILDPDRLPERIKRDKTIEREIQRVWNSNFKVYGANKVWRQLIREGIQVARCTVERLMKKLGIKVSDLARSVGRRMQMICLAGQQTRLIGNS
ncbi:MAG: IS3 family transposase [Burkholderiales bacterium]|nr:IS3 family transposase [Burkholderiales bacterium]